MDFSKSYSPNQSPAGAISTGKNKTSYPLKPQLATSVRSRLEETRGRVSGGAAILQKALLREVRDEDRLKGVVVVVQLHPKEVLGSWNKPRVACGPWMFCPILRPRKFF